MVAYRTIIACLIFSFCAMPLSAQINDLTCTYDSEFGEISFSWSNTEFYDIIEVFQDGELIDELLGNLEEHIVAAPTGVPSAEYCFEAVGFPIDPACCVVDFPVPPVEALSCSVESGSNYAQFKTTWTNGADDYDEILVYANDILMSTLAGDATSAQIPCTWGQAVRVDIVANRDSVSSSANTCTELLPDLPPGVLDLQCSSEPGSGEFVVVWINGAEYDTIELYLDGDLLDELAGDATGGTYVDEATGVTKTLEVVAIIDELELTNSCSFELPSLSWVPPVDLELTLENNGVRGTYSLPPTTVDFVDVYRNGVLVLEDLDPSEEQFFDEIAPGFPESHVTYHVAARCPDGGTSFSEPATIFVSPASQATFIRGECNGDGDQNIADVIKMLVYLYLADDESSILPCPEACDFDASGVIDIIDVLAQLDYLFRGGEEPAHPFPDCGVDGDGSSLGCPTFQSCPRPNNDWIVWWSHTQTSLFSLGEQPPRLPAPTGGGAVTHVGDAVIANNSGEVFYSPPMPHGGIVSRFPHDILALTYASQIDFESPIGRGWNLWPLTDGVVQRPNGNVRRFDSLTVRFDDYDDETGEAESCFDQVDNDCDSAADDPSDDVVCFRAPDGTRTVYLGFNGKSTDGLFLLVEDRFGNVIRAQHDEDTGRITSLTNQGRVTTYGYDADGMLESVTDPFGRVTQFSYNNAKQLVEVTLPAITGTPDEDDGIPFNGPDGNDFPDGKTYRFAYDSTNPDPVLRDNLVSVTCPNEVATDGPPQLQFSYGEDPTAVDFDRVVVATVGGARAPSVTGGEDSPTSGGSFQFQYEDLGFPLPGEEAEIRCVEVRDPQGAFLNLYFDDRKRCVREVTLTAANRNKHLADQYTKSYGFRVDNQLTSITYPGGNSIEFEYDSDNPNRAAQGNLIEARSIPDLARGADQNEIVTIYTYEPIFNQLRTVTGPRGNDEDFTPPNTIPDAELLLIDFNLDGDGDDEADGESAQRRRYTTLYTYDYQDGTADAIADLALAEGVELDLDGDGVAEIAAALSEGTNDNPTTFGNAVTVQRVATGQEGITSKTLSWVWTRAYDDLGQLTSVADPEGSLTTIAYYPENDPDGDGTVIDDDSLNTETGGYIRVTVTDDDAQALIVNPGTERRTRSAPEAVVTTTYEYDPAGNVTAITDARGVRTEYVVNSHNQVVLEIRAAAVDSTDADPDEPTEEVAFYYNKFFSYDFNGNLVQVGVEDVGQTSGSDKRVTYYKYELTNVMVTRIEDPTPDKSIVTEYRYDTKGNHVLTIHPEGNATSFYYDDRGQLFKRTDGAHILPPDVHIRPDDPITFDVRGGLPSTTFYNYDANGNLVEISDSDDSDLSSDNNSEIGNGDRTRMLYDGFDRRVSVVDAAGNQSVTQYDPNSNVVRVLSFGATEGLTATSDGTPQQPVSELGEILSGNLVNTSLLAATEFLFDELNRCFQTDEVLFHNSTATVRAVDIEDGALDAGKDTLIPADDFDIPGLTSVTILGRVNTIREFDRNSCVVNLYEDDGDVTTHTYDGLNRCVETVDAAGNSTEYAYDDNNNLIEVQETDVSDLAGIADEQLVTTYFYDSLNRCRQITNNLGHTSYFRYDSRDNLVARADARGPVGDTLTRRAFSGGSQTSNITNEPGNVTLYTYDTINRLLTTERILTTSGEGNGLLGVDADGVPNDTLSPDETQAGGDGIIRTGFVYDDNSNVIATIDDQGNATVNVFDNQDRCVSTARGLTVDSVLNTVQTLDDAEIPMPTAHTMGAPLYMPVSLIDDQLAVTQDLLFEQLTLFPPLADSFGSPTATLNGYDNDCNLRVTRDENGSEWQYGYDALNRRVAARAFRAGQPDTHVGDARFATPARLTFTPANFAVPQNVTIQNFNFDGLSRCVRAEDFNDPDSDDDDVVIERSFDSLSRIVEETRRISYDPDVTCTSGWRTRNLRRSMTFPDGEVAIYDFDALDRVRAITDQDGAGNDDELVTFEFMGPRVLTVNYPLTGVTMSTLDPTGTLVTGFDGLRRPTELRHTNDAGTTLLAFTHSYDRASNRLTHGKDHDGDNSEDLGYDSADRVTSFARPPGSHAVLHPSWTLDGVGNWKSVGGEDREHSNFNELISRTDDTGNLVESSHDGNHSLSDDGNFAYTYDALKRLVRVADAADETTIVAEYVYDAFDRRVRKTVPDLVGGTVPTVTEFVYDGSEVQAITVGASTKRFLRARGLCHVMIDAARNYFHTDLEGSTYGLSDEDGELVEAHMYDAYGRPTLVSAGLDGILDFGADDEYTAATGSALENPFLFQGMLYDDETSLYSDGTGKFIDWDRGRALQQSDENSSCWIRMSQNWAGKTVGSSRRIAIGEAGVKEHVATLPGGKTAGATRRIAIGEAGVKEHVSKLVAPRRGNRIAIGEPGVKEHVSNLMTAPDGGGAGGSGTGGGSGGSVCGSKPHVNIGTIGHVDHGKTTLSSDGADFNLWNAHKIHINLASDRKDMLQWYKSMVEGGSFSKRAPRRIAIGEAGVEEHVSNLGIAPRGGPSGSDTTDGSDFILWNAHKFTPTPGFSSGSSGNRVSDGSDFNLWNAHKFHKSARRGGKVTLLKRTTNSPLNISPFGTIPERLPADVASAGGDYEIKTVIVNGWPMQIIINK